ncbi:hypothetical protein NFI96_018144, partial [Prochilodus magdalenae]
TLSALVRLGKYRAEDTSTDTVDNTRRVQLMILSRVTYKCSIFSLTEGERLKVRVRRRRQACTNVTYTYYNKVTEQECCRCPAGFHFTQHCLPEGGYPKCEVCEEGTHFLDNPNAMEGCEHCEPCEEPANMEIVKECTAFSNTVCGCKKDHYCDKGLECKACHKCDTCTGFGVKVPCNSTSNTVCNETPESNLSAPVAAIVLPILFVLLLIGGAVWSWRKQLFCFKPPPNAALSSEVSPILEDVDLTNFLPEIAQKLGLKVVKKVTRQANMLTNVEIENIEHDHSNAEEQTYQLLNNWYQKHGLKGAYSTLIMNLTKSGHKRSADEVKLIVIKGQRHEDLA